MMPRALGPLAHSCWLVALLLAGCTDGAPPAPGGGGDDLGSAGPPFFTNLVIDPDTGDRAVVRFTTALDTSCEALYGTSPDALTLTATDPDMTPGRRVTDHKVPLENLTPLTTYFFRARAKDAGGNLYLSEISSLTTSAGDAVLAMTNVARASAGATVVAVSSNYAGASNGGSWGADHAIDGDMYSEWSTNGDGDAASLTIDLGQPRTVTWFGFRSRKMRDGTSIITSVRLTFDDGALTLGPFATPDPDHRYAFPFAQPVTARRLRVDAVTTTGGNTGAKEIQLFQ